MENKKLQKLFEVHDEHIQRNGRTLGRRELLADKIQSIPPLPLPNLRLNAVSLSLVIENLLLLFGQHLRIALRATEAGTTLANATTDEFGQLDPAVIAIEFAAKLQVEIL